MEAIFRTVSWSDFPKDFKMGFKLMRTPMVGWTMLSVANGFIKKVLPQATVRVLTKEEMAERMNSGRQILAAHKKVTP